MSIDAAATVAQIIPVLYIAWAIELGMQINPELKGWRRAPTAIVLGGVIALTAVVEIVAVRAVIFEQRLPPVWRGLSFLAITSGVTLVVGPHLTSALGMDPVRTFERGEARRKQREAARLTKRERRKTRGRRVLRRAK